MKTNSIDSQPQIECILCFVRLIRVSKDYTITFADLCSLSYGMTQLSAV